MTPVREKLAEEPMFDGVIVKHGFLPHMRDYEIFVVSNIPRFDQPNRIGPRKIRYQFTHCVIANYVTAVKDKFWKEAWDDVFINEASWEKAGEPDGYVWGIGYSQIYPGETYIDNSDEAKAWSERLGHPMHELLIETNAYNLKLIFHDVIINVGPEYPIPAKSK